MQSLGWFIHVAIAIAIGIRGGGGKWKELMSVLLVIVAVLNA